MLITWLKRDIICNISMFSGISNLLINMNKKKKKKIHKLDYEHYWLKWTWNRLRGVIFASIFSSLVHFDEQINRKSLKKLTKIRTRSKGLRKSLLVVNCFSLNKFLVRWGPKVAENKPGSGEAMAMFYCLISRQGWCCYNLMYDFKIMYKKVTTFGSTSTNVNSSPI